MQKKSAKRLLWVVYSVFFLYNLHLSLGLYLNSSFLSEGCACGIPERMVGVLFALGSLGGIIVTLMVRRLALAASSSKKLFLIAGATSLATLLGFIFSHSAAIVAVLFILYWMSSYLVIFLADIFVESYSDDQTTGDTRGVFLTIAGLGTMLAPLAAGNLADAPGGFFVVYIIGGILGALSMLVFAIFAKKIKEPQYQKVSILKGVRVFLQNKNFRGVFVANFLLQFFFSWMIIYTPIYLIQHVGLSWSNLGIIFTVMLLPFVLIQIPLGKIADRLLGEKEIMIAGVVIIALSTTAVAFLNTQSIWHWIIILMLTRIGASALQVASESYFFKQVNESNINVISIFRLTSPAAFLIGPLVGTILLGLPDFAFKNLYLVLAVIVLLALPGIAQIQDSR